MSPKGAHKRGGGGGIGKKGRVLEKKQPVLGVKECAHDWPGGKGGPGKKRSGGGGGDLGIAKNRGGGGKAL